MKHLILTLLIAGTFVWGCAPSEPPPAEAVATPTATTGGEITEMDFESGEVDENAAASEEPAAEPTPDAPNE